MKSINWFNVIIGGTIPEIILAVYLQGVWYMDFLPSLLAVYAISFILVFVRFLTQEILFRIFTKNTLINQFYEGLVSDRYPNPWNYHIDDGISYFLEVAEDINGELIDPKIRVQAMGIYAGAKMLETTHNLGSYWRIKKCYTEAVKLYMDNNFPEPDSI